MDVGTDEQEARQVALRITEAIIARIPFEQLLAGALAPMKGDAPAIGVKFGQLYSGVLEKVTSSFLEVGWPEPQKLTPKPGGNGGGHTSGRLSDLTDLLASKP